MAAGAPSRQQTEQIVDEWYARSSCVMLRSSPKSDAGADEDSIRSNYDRDHYAGSQNQLTVPPDEAPQIRQGLPQKWSRAARFKASRSRRLSGPCDATCAAAAASISALH
jgi:hypothetical protein